MTKPKPRIAAMPKKQKHATNMQLALARIAELEAWQRRYGELLDRLVVEWREFMREANHVQGG